MASKETLISWLNDAYAMERALIPILENHFKDARDLPHVVEKFQEHAAKTTHHAALVKSCLGHLEASPSITKTALGAAFGQIQALSTEAFGDEVVKNFLTDYAAEHFEIACYRALIAAAQELGESEIARICAEILRDEEDMARFLEQHLPSIVRDYLMVEARS